MGEGGRFGGGVAFFDFVAVVGGEAGKGLPEPAGPGDFEFRGGGSIGEAEVDGFCVLGEVAGACFDEFGLLDKTAIELEVGSDGVAVGFGATQRESYGVGSGCGIVAEHLDLRAKAVLQDEVEGAVSG